MINVRNHLNGIPVGPLPVPDDVRTILIYGGTFDPPHRAHLELPIRARDAIGADWLLYCPAARSPFKEATPDATDDDRIAMLAAGLAGQDRVGISTLDLEPDKPGQPSYTIDLLDRLSATLPAQCRLHLLIGTDQALGFHRWKSARQIIERAQPVVMRRSEAESSEDLLQAMAPHWSNSELEKWRQLVLTLPVIDVSATQLRSLLANLWQGGLDPVELQALEELVPTPVLDVIRKQELYRPKSAG